MRQEFAVVMLNGNGKATINQNAISDWMLGVKTSQADAPTPSRTDNETSFKVAEQAAFSRLSALTTPKLLPDSIQWVSGAWSPER